MNTNENNSSLEENQNLEEQHQFNQHPTDSRKNQENEHDVKPSHKKRKTINTALIIFFSIVVIIGGAVGFFIYKYQDNQKKQEEITKENREANKASFFSMKAYNKIPESYKEHLYYFVEYNNFNDGTYFLTKIEDRANDVFAFGDFTNDDNDEDDMAVILELNDFQSSKLVILNHNGELLFTQDYSYLPTIKSFKVGSKIYMDEIKLVPAPVGGLLIMTENSKSVLLYDKKTKKFNTYHQYTQEEIDEMNNPGAYYEEEGDDDPAAEQPSSESENKSSDKDGVLGIF